MGKNDGAASLVRSDALLAAFNSRMKELRAQMEAVPATSMDAHEHCARIGNRINGLTDAYEIVEREAANASRQFSTRSGDKLDAEVRP